MLLRTARTLPSDQSRWAFEIKYDGYRALVYIENGQTRIFSRQQRDMTAYYPELQAIAEALPARSAILDGELVGMRADGIHDFELLQQRSGFSEHRASTHVAISLQIFDLLHLDGRPLLQQPYERRRGMLEGLQLQGPHWCVPQNYIGQDASALLEATRQAGLEGLVAKRLDSRYEPGLRTGAWLKIKNWRQEEFLLCGWKEDEEEGYDGWLGALLLGRETDGTLRYVGGAHPGADTAELKALAELLPQMETKSCPFEIPPAKKRIHYVEPRLRLRVEFREWTDSGKVRIAVFRGFVL